MKKQQPGFVIHYANSLDYQKTIARAVEDLAAECDDLDLKKTLLQEFTGDRLKDKLIPSEEKLKARTKFKKTCRSDEPEECAPIQQPDMKQWHILVCRSRDRQTIGVTFFRHVYPQFFQTYKPVTKVDEEAKKSVSLRIFWMAVRGHARKSVGRKPPVDDQGRYASAAMMAEVEKFAQANPRIHAIEAYIHPNDTQAMRVAQNSIGLRRSDLRTAKGQIRYIKHIDRTVLSAK